MALTLFGLWSQPNKMITITYAVNVQLKALNLCYDTYDTITSMPAALTHIYVTTGIFPQKWRTYISTVVPGR